jgi:hypothetical protein
MSEKPEFWPHLSGHRKGFCLSSNKYLSLGTLKSFADNE